MNTAEKRIEKLNKLITTLTTRVDQLVVEHSNTAASIKGLEDRLQRERRETDPGIGG